MTKLCYGTNNEDFNFDFPEEALDDAWEDDALENSDGFFYVYEGELTSEPLLEPPGSFAVIPKRTLKFKARYYEEYCVPDWVPVTDD